MRKHDSRYNSAETSRQANRRWVNRLNDNPVRRIFSPERDIDRFYARYDFEVQPDVIGNARLAGRFRRHR